MLHKAMKRSEEFHVMVNAKCSREQAGKLRNAEIGSRFARSLTGFRECSQEYKKITAVVLSNTKQ